jgi:hypothetical protein
MIDDQTILLRQILDELKQQNQYLFDIRRRLESLENLIGKDQSKTERAVDRMKVG